jgi:uncharacterized protein involved in exopolysaccharide biosynthesis
LWEVFAVARRRTYPFAGRFRREKSMLQAQGYQRGQLDGGSEQALRPQYFYEVLKRRAFYFAIPFVLVLTVGSFVAAVWPARYLAQGTILVQSQEIPSDLVRPTIAALANDRIKIIEQRVMTRDNLLAIAKKYQLASGWMERVSGTEIVDLIRKRTIIKPSEQKLESRKKEAIAFTIGFEYERPDIATKVANEFVTMLLAEDVRSRTEFAAQTTRFLAQEVARLEGRLSTVDTQIAAIKKTKGDSSDLDSSKQLAALKNELSIKSATFSNSHPEIMALKRRIAAMEKSTSDTSGQNGANLDTLETQKVTIVEELNKATQKLSAARLGENLEKGQHSERLEVIEQPTTPQKPVSPNRPKLFAAVFALALMAGGAMVFAAEMLNQSIRRTADLYSLIDRQMVVAIPYIATRAETKRRARKTNGTYGLIAAAALAGIVLLFFILPPIDLLLDKVIALFNL